MDRRGFTAGLATAGICAGSPSAAIIRGDDGRQGLPPFGYVWIDASGTAQIGVPSRIVVVSRAATFEIGLNFKFPMENEERSGVLNQTLQRQFSRREQIGEVRFGGRTIWINAEVALQPTEFRLTDFEISFRINGVRLARRFTGQIPNLARLPNFGFLFRRQADAEMKQNLMVYLAPEILHFAE